MKIGAFAYLDNHPNDDNTFVVLQHIKKPKNSFMLNAEKFFKVIFSENNDYYNVGDNITLYSFEYIEVTNKLDIEKYNKIAIFQ